MKKAAVTDDEVPDTVLISLQGQKYPRCRPHVDRPYNEYIH